MENCKNCDNELKSEDKFCSNCGQKNIQQLRLKTLLGELAAAFLSWDSKLFKTLKLLLFRPGQVSKNYSRGKRKSYVAPLRMYFFFSVCFFLFVSFFGTQVSEQPEAQENIFQLDLNGDTASYPIDSLILMDQHDELDQLPEIKEISDPTAREFVKQAVRVSIQSGGFSNYLRKNISFMFFVFMPVFAWVLKLFYRKNRLDYIEHLVYALYFHSFIFCTLLITLGISHLIEVAWPIIVGVGIILLYLYLGLKNFYERSYIRTFFKSIFIIITYVLLFGVFATATVLITVWFY